MAILNQKDPGYRGIWYMNQPSNDEYVYKYSGGLGTYCAKHQPFAVYCKAVHKTFFCYGGTTSDDWQHLVHMVSYYDHETGQVPRPTLLMDKQTSDAHDNPVISVDDQGYIWIFSTAHGRDRPSYIHKSRTPYSIDIFEPISATKQEDDQAVPLDNFSYMQAWHRSDKGFGCFFTRYNYPADRTLCWMTSKDGITWSPWTRLAAMEKGHYQVSAMSSSRAGTAFNMHPAPDGLNWRTNLYYMETRDWGETWTTIEGTPLALPLMSIETPALIHDYKREGLKVYLKDIRFDQSDRPVILFLTSPGYASGPQNDPRTWTIAHWTGIQWDIRPAFTSDNNYDMGSLYIEENGTWRIIAPTATGPQPYNPGGEMVMWTSEDEGRSWMCVKQLTTQSIRNHTYARRPVLAHPDFYALWADGNARTPSESCLYFCDKEGTVRMLPQEIQDEFAEPIAVGTL